MSTKVMRCVCCFIFTRLTCSHIPQQQAWQQHKHNAGGANVYARVDEAVFVAVVCSQLLSLQVLETSFAQCVI